MLMKARAKPTRMTSSQRRDQILDVAKNIVAKDGFLAVTMGRLAEEAGITRTLIYQQFGDLTGVFSALVEREFAEELAVYLRSTAMHPGGGVRQFVSVMASLLKRVDANPAAWRLFLMPPEGSPAELYQRLQEARAMVHYYLAESLRSAMGEGKAVVLSDDVELGAQSVQAVAEQLLRLRLEAPDYYSHERLLQQVKTLSELLFAAAQIN